MRKRIVAVSAIAVCFTGELLAIEFGNFDLLQLNNTNNGLDAIEDTDPLTVDGPAVAISVAPGSSANFNFTGANRGDIDVTFGTPDDVANGVMITAVRENGRDNSAGGDPVKTEYVTPLGEYAGGANAGRFFIPLETAPDSEEWNIDTAAVYFPFNEGWLCGHTRNSTNANGGIQDVLTATSGIGIGTHFFDNGGGNFTVNLASLSSHGAAATSQNGVLLVTGMKNEDNYALSSDNGNGSFTVILKDNEASGAASERDPIAFAYVPVAAAGPDLVTAVGRVQSDGSSEIAGGNFTVTKLTGSVAPVATTADTTELGSDLVVANATGIAVDQIVTGDGIAAGTRVTAVNGTTVTLSLPATATASQVALTFTTPPTPGRWLLEIPGQSETTGTLIVTPCTGDVNNLDNIVSYQWDGSLGANGGWVIESRDLVPGFGKPVLEDGASAGEDMFNFAFFTTSPSNAQPAIAITSPANGAEIGTGNSVTITADASDPAPGSVVAVEFYLNGSLVATDTAAPYEFTTPVYNLPAGFKVDAVARDNNGARTFAPQVVFTVTPPAGSGGLYFNGANEYVGLGDPASLKLSTFTLETWFRRVGPGVATTTGTGGVVAVPLVTKGRNQADQSNLDTNYFLGIRESDGVLVADFEDSNLGVNVPVAGTTPIPTDEWQHAAVTFDGTEWKLYLNGNLEATRNAGGLVPRADSIQQAAIATALTSTGVPAGFFNGYLDEVRIWNVARTQSQLRASTDFEIATATGLVARWGMTEGSGTSITSSADGALAGNLVNAPFWTAGQTFTGNIRPDVAVSSPAEGTRYLVGETIPITASASDPDGSIARVEFFDNGVSLGVDTTAPFELSYANAPLGGYHRLTAVATDLAGATSLSGAVTVDVTVTPPLIPGYSAGVANGGDQDADTVGVLPADPATWLVESTTQSPRAFDLPGTDTGDLAVNIAGSPVAFGSGVLLATNHSVIGSLAATDNSLATYRGAGGGYVLSSVDNENPGAADPLVTEESSRFSLGFFPYANGWIGANVDAAGIVLDGSSNLPPGVTIANPATGVYRISGLPTSGNLLPVGGGDGNDNVITVAQDGADWVLRSRDNSQNLENSAFGFVYVPATSRQVFSGQVTDAGGLVALNDELAAVGATVNRGTQGYEVSIGDGNIINPSNSVMFVTADEDVGFAGDNVLSYSAAGNVFVVFSQDLPALSGQFQSGGFRFLIVPRDPVAINGDEVVVFATDKEATENSPDDIVFTFTRSGSTAAPLTVSYTVGGTATSGDDFSGLAGTVTFPAGAASVAVPVSAEGDILLELAETVSVTITAGSGYSVGVFNAAFGTLLNAAPLIPTTTVTFQEGTNGYTGQFDKRVGLSVNQLGSAVSNYFLDGRPSNASPDINGLLRFDNLFGNGPGQIPPGAEVTDARLFITTSTVTDAQSGGPWIIDRLMVPVDESTTYASLGGDPNTATYDGFEGARGASTGIPVAGFGALASGQVGEADVTELVQAWASGEPNHGFSILTGGTTDGWSYNTVGNPNPVLRPKLQVTYTMLAVKEYLFETDRSAVVNSQAVTQDGSTLETLFMDLNDPTTGTTEGLLRFPVNFGSGAVGSIPIGEEVVKAELLMVTNSPVFLGSANAQTGGFYAVHQMTTDWTVEAPNPTSFGNLGPVVGTHIEPAAARFTGMGWSATSYVDVTSIVRNWRAGSANHGLNVKPETTDGWQPFLPGALNNVRVAGAVPKLRIQTAIITPSLFDAWAAAKGIPSSNFNEDQDRDGIVALLEYALGFDPLVKDILPGLGPDLGLSFPKGPDAAADPALVYTLETSSDLIQWTPLPGAVNGATRISGQLPANSGKVFGRLSVDYNP
jgi:hypothetical protein